MYNECLWCTCTRWSDLPVACNLSSLRLGVEATSVWNYIDFDASLASRALTVTLCINVSPNEHTPIVCRTLPITHARWNDALAAWLFCFLIEPYGTHANVSTDAFDMSWNSCCKCISTCITLVLVMLHVIADAISIWLVPTRIMPFMRCITIWNNDYESAYVYYWLKAKVVTVA